jgi:hypothetical protein
MRGNARAAQSVQRTGCHEGPRLTSTGPVQESLAPRLIGFPVGPAVLWASAEPVRWVQGGAFKISAPQFRPPIKMMRYRG